MKPVLFALSLVAGLGGVATASAWEGYEHRKMSDQGFIKGLQWANEKCSSSEKCKGTLPQLPWRGNVGGRWVTCARQVDGENNCEQLSVSDDSKDHSRGNPIMVWVGSEKTGVWASFGDLVMVYADHIPTVDEMLNLPPGDFQDLRGTANKDGIKNNPNIKKYLDLAFQNSDHFGQTAVLAYTTYHAKAYELAHDAVVKKDLWYLWKALHYEALAVHSLTDLFAAGHVFVNDRKLAADAYKKGGFFNSARGIVGGIWDKWGPNRHDTWNKSGCNMKALIDLTSASSQGNAVGLTKTGAGFFTYGDGKLAQLAQGNSQSKIARPEYMEQAVGNSVFSILFPYMLMRSVANDAGQVDLYYKNLKAGGWLYYALAYVPSLFCDAKGKEVFSDTKCVDNCCAFPIYDDIRNAIGAGSADDPLAAAARGRPQLTRPEDLAPTPPSPPVSPPPSSGTATSSVKTGKTKLKSAGAMFDFNGGKFTIRAKDKKQETWPGGTEVEVSDQKPNPGTSKMCKVRRLSDDVEAWLLCAFLQAENTWK